MKNKNMTLYHQLAAYMFHNKWDHIDPATGEVSATTLAEDTAINGFNKPEWLDDETHIVWEVAVDIAERHQHTVKE